MKNLPVVVIGPGAIGTWLAWRLSAKSPVELVGRGKAWLARARRGLRVRGGAGRRPRRRATIILSLRATQPAAAVFICVKSRDTVAALAQARRAAGPATPVVSLQNGLAHLAPTLRRFGSRRAVFGACYAAVTREGSAAVRHHAGRAVWLGQTPENKAAVAAARRILLAAGLDAPSPAPQGRVLWTKLLFNAAANPVGALTGRPNGELASAGALREVMLTALEEAERAAKGDGHAPLARDLAGHVLRNCAAAPGQENSMLQDLRAGRPTEAEAILGPILAAARRRRQRTPVLSSLHRFVLRLEKELSR